MSAQLCFSTKLECLDNFTLSVESLTALCFLISNEQLLVKQRSCFFSFAHGSFFCDDLDLFFSVCIPFCIMCLGIWL